MRIVEIAKDTILDFPATTGNPEELARLQEFFQRMKDAGIARTREYDLPHPDTLGRAIFADFGRDSRSGI